jgi:hypothetical protein
MSYPQQVPTRALPQGTLALTREGDSRRRDPASGVPPRLSAMLSFTGEDIVAERFTLF